MKFLLLFLIFTTTLLNRVDAQILNYKAKLFSSGKPSDIEKNWIACDVLVIIDTVNNKLKIFWSEKKEYDIIKVITDRSEVGSYSIAFKVVDNKGVECIMTLSTVNNQSYNALLIIAYKNYRYAYKMIDN